MRDRFKDVRMLIGDDYDLGVHLAKEDALTYAWQGGREMAGGESSDFAQLVVSKKLYEEHGSNICKERFELM